MKNECVNSIEFSSPTRGGSTRKAGDGGGCASTPTMVRRQQTSRSAPPPPLRGTFRSPRTDGGQLKPINGGGRIGRFFFTTIAGLLVACPAYGQVGSSSLSDEVIAIGERVGNTKLSQLTSPATIITADDIESGGFAYVSDILRTVPGFSISQSGGRNQLTSLRVRGAEANQVRVFIDGIDVSNPSDGAFDFAGLRTKDIVRIEILRGEQSALYGSDAIGGVINIISRSGNTGRSGSLSIEGGSYNTYESQLSATIPVGNATLSVNGNLLKTDGYDVSGTNGDEDGNQSESINVGLNNIKFGGIAVQANLSANHSNLEFDAGPNLDAENVTDSNTLRASTSARFNLLSFDHIVTFGTSSRDAKQSGTFVNTSDTRRTNISWAAEYNFNESSALTILGETEKDEYDLFAAGFFGGTVKESTRNTGVAADYRLTHRQFTLSLSGRHDFNDRFDDAFTWQIGTSLQLPKLNSRLRASAGTGIQNPTLTELFGFAGSGFTPNPNLIPETSTGFNLGYEQNLFEDTAQISIDAFYSELKNEISGFFFPVNDTDKSTRKGVEVQAHWAISPSLNIKASATYLNAKDKFGREIRRPDTSGSLQVDWRLTDKFSISGTMTHTGEQLDSVFLAPTYARMDIPLKSFTLVGLNIRYSLNDIVTLSLRGENLLDENYQEVVGYHSQGRGVYAGISADF